MFFNFKNRVPKLGAVFSRFPVPVLLMAIVTMVLIRIDVYDDQDKYIGLSAGLIFAAYMLVSWTVSREARGLSVLLPFQLIFAAIIFIIAWNAKSLLFDPYIAVFGSIVLLGNAVRWRRERDDLHVWDYSHKIWIGAGLATVGSIIFVIGTLAIVEALRYLFGVDIEDLLTDYILPIGLAFLAPLYWMSTVPEVDEDFSYLHDNPDFIAKSAANMAAWLMVPLVLIYGLILLAYIGQILLSQELPKGEIAYITTPFLIIGTLTWLILEPPFIQKLRITRLFRKTWFWVAIPVSILLGIAVGVRVQQYGLTVERILLIICSLSSLGLSIWFAFRHEKYKDIRYLPGLVGALIILSAFTAPFISVHNQHKRFVYHMKQTGVITDGQFNKDRSIQDLDAAKKAKGALSYLYNMNQENRVGKTFEKWDLSDDGQDRKTAFYTLGLDKVDVYSRQAKVREYRNYESYIDIKKFDYVSNAKRFYDQELGAFDNLILDLKDLSVIGKQTDGRKLFEVDLEKTFEAFEHGDTEYKISNPYIELYADGDREIYIYIVSLNRRNNYRPHGDFYVLVKGFTPKP